MVAIQTNMHWDAVALGKYNKMLNLIPVFHRRLAKEVVNKKAEQWRWPAAHQRLKKWTLSRHF